MLYATIADFIAKYGAEYLASLTNSDPSNDVPDDDKLAFALLEATAEIDMYLGKCYEVPLVVPLPPILMFKTLVLARYHLESGCDCSEKVQKQYDAAVEWLHSACCGDCPPAIPGLDKQSDRTDGVVHCSLPRVFTRCNLSPYTQPRYGYGYNREGRDRNYKNYYRH